MLTFLRKLAILGQVFGDGGLWNLVYVLLGLLLVIILLKAILGRV